MIDRRPQTQYSAMKTTIKGLTMFLVPEFAIFLSDWLNQLPEDFNVFTDAWPVHATALVAALWKAWLNWNKNKDNGKLKTGLPSWFILGLAGSMLFVSSGCAGLAPAAFGKTKYSVEFHDNLWPAEGVAATGLASESGTGQDTSFVMKIEAPAGVELSELTGMDYAWNPDGSGAIAINSEAGVNSVGQAALIGDLVRAQTELVGSIAALASPLVGQHMELQSLEAMQPNEPSFQSQFLQLLADPTFRQQLIDMLGGGVVVFKP